jgi:ribosomal protein L7/L12
VPAGRLGEAGDRGYGVTPEILALIEQDRKIQAIKRYRQLNPGTGLKEAKDVIDGLAGRRSAAESGKGRW